MVGLDQHLAWQSIAGLHNCHWAELSEYTAGWRIAAHAMSPKRLPRLGRIAVNS